MRELVAIIRAASAVVMAVGAMAAVYFVTREDPAVGPVNALNC